MHVVGPRELPLVALRETVIFPEMIVPLQVGRDKSVAALNAAVASNGPIALVTQRQAEQEDIGDPSELYTVGTLARIAQVVQTLYEGATTELEHTPGEKAGVVHIRGLGEFAYASPRLCGWAERALERLTSLHLRCERGSSFLHTSPTSQLQMLARPTQGRHERPRQ